MPPQFDYFGTVTPTRPAWTPPAPPSARGSAPPPPPGSDKKKRTGQTRGQRRLPKGTVLIALLVAIVLTFPMWGRVVLSPILQSQAADDAHELLASPSDRLPDFVGDGSTPVELGTGGFAVPRGWPVRRLAKDHGLFKLDGVVVVPPGKVRNNQNFLMAVHVSSPFGLANIDLKPGEISAADLKLDQDEQTTVTIAGERAKEISYTGTSFADPVVVHRARFHRGNDVYELVEFAYGTGATTPMWRLALDTLQLG
jgi:hypothetical protein